MLTSFDLGAYTQPGATTQTRQSMADFIRRNIAQSMVGRTVQLLVSPNQVRSGVVTAVETEAGKPKVIVSGLTYDLSQILTAVPSAFN